MSWDISMCKFSQDYASIEDMPQDGQCLSMGEASEIRDRISQIFIGTDWSEPQWGKFDCPFGSIEFNMGSDAEVLDGFMMHVRAGDELIAPIVELAIKNGWQALDCSSCDFLEKLEHPAEGLRQWRAFRDLVI